MYLNKFVKFVKLGEILPIVNFTFYNTTQNQILERFILENFNFTYLSPLLQLCTSLQQNFIHMSNQDQDRKATLRSLLKQSFIQQQNSPFIIKVLRKVDIFSFIPVPKDQPVSTKQSLLGTGIFFLIFLTYIIYDFYQFVSQNPPSAQNFYTKLDQQTYPLPRFAITYMRGNFTQVSDQWNTYLNFILSKQSKDKGSEEKTQVPIFTNNFKPSNTKIYDDIQWIDKDTKSFYNVLRTSSQPLYSQGLLYSTFNASYAKVKVQLCNINKDPSMCEKIQDIQKFCAEGRIFLFLQNILDTTDFAAADSSTSNKFLIYNSFLQPFVYKRVTFNFRVVKTQVYPDYFFRWQTQRQTRLQIQSYVEQSSNVKLNAPINTTPLDMLGIQFQLAPQVLNVKVTYKTLIDHVSMWGALWGVLFAIFAIIFLTYNREKFYKKNPEWNRFKQNHNNEEVDGQTFQKNT